MPAPVGTAGNVASMWTLRSVPFGLKAFVGLTHAAVSTTDPPYRVSVIFKSSHVCNSILNCARASDEKSAEHKADNASSTRLRVCLGSINDLLLSCRRILSPAEFWVNDL